MSGRSPVCYGLALLLSAPAAALGKPAQARSTSEAPPRSPTRQALERALAAAVAEGDRHTEARARRDLGALLYEQTRYDEAQTELLTALRLFEAVGDRAGAGWTLHYLGRVAYTIEPSGVANEYWTRGLAEMEAAHDRRGEAELVSDRIHATRPGPEKAALLQRGLQLAGEIGDARLQATVLSKIGEQQTWDGNYAAALETLQEAVGRFEKIGADDSVARTFLLLGRLHVIHGEPARARPFYQRALGILRRLGDRPGIAEATGAMATMHRVLGDLQRAAVVARRAMTLVAEVAGVRQVNQERLRLAWIYIELGDYRRARTLLDEVVRGPDAFTRDLAYDPLAEVHLASGEYEQARHAADLAARGARELWARPFMLANRARAEDKLGRSGDAMGSIDEALQIAEHVRGQLVPTDSMKQGYAERVQRLFSFAVDLRARLGRHAAALEAAEQARARAFLDLLATRDAMRPASGGDDTDLRSGAAADPFSLAQLTEAAGRLRSTLLTYWVGSERTIVWVIDAGGLVHTAIVPIPAARLTSLVAQTWRNAGTIAPVLGADPGLFVRTRPPTTAWRSLYDVLIRPVGGHLPTASDALLTIIPHGPLSRLSFAGLRDERGRYLVERYALHYVPAGAVLADRRPTRPTSAAPGPTYLLVANPARSSREAGGGRLSPLPGAAGEIRRISRLLPAGSATPLSGTSAREGRVRELLSSRRVVHFATHAVLRDDRPLDSFLSLGRGDAHDGRLTAREIYDLTLDADLVVLSACRTATGPITGDGIVGLTRAFFYAGTRSVVATLWDLADESGREAMPAFYRAWLDGHDKARALQSAQIALLSRLRARRAIVNTGGHRVILEEDPFLWAGFVLVGEP